MGIRSKAFAGVVVVAVLGVWMGQRASAAPPPPPSFWGFTIRNTTNQNVVNVRLQLISHQPNMFHLLDVNNPIDITIAKIPPGREVVISLPGDGTDAVSKILVVAECPAESIANLEITAEQMNFDTVLPGMEYAGFSRESPTGYADYTPTLEFRPKSGGGYEAHLHAKARWGTYYSPSPKEDLKPFAP